jgi:polyisoprenoid-binding protein YceI
MPRALALVAALLLVPGELRAAPRSFVLDPARTILVARFGATLQRVRANLGSAAGTIRFDDRGGPARGDIVLDLTQAETGVGRRDRKMHEKILETPKYPRAVLHLERLDLPEGLRPGTNHLQLHGPLEFHGETRPIAIPLVAEVAGDNVTANGSIVVPYVEWGLTDPSWLLLRVAKSVTVEIQAAGRLSTEP